MKLQRRRCFWLRMTPVSSRVLNCSLTAAERRSDRQIDIKDGQESKERLVPMTSPKLSVQVAINSWRLVVERANKIFSTLTEDELLKEVAPGRNRLMYLWGHLTAIHDAMLPLLGLGKRLYSEFDVAFVINPDKSQTVTPSHEEIRRAWITVNGELSKGFEKMSQSDWLQRHSAV